MKRLVGAFLAFLIAATSALPAYAFMPPDRLSDSLAEKQEIAFETTVEKAGNKALSEAAIMLGKNLDGTITFSHYINKKTLTLQEFNAFRWSFIFSQFALPFQDNMQTVFNQSLFQQMESQGIQLQSVAESLSSVSTIDIAKIGTAGMMLQGSDFKELKDTIIGNLYYLTVYNAYGGGVTINDIFFGGGDAGQVFYVYDYVSGLDSSANDYYFHQERLGNEMEVDGNFSSKAYPCFILNNTSMLYLQIAFGAYLKSQDMDYGSFQERWGNYNVYLDSYGNLCTYDGEKYVIFFPNFANSIFINTEAEGVLEERVFAYNKWLSSAYSSTLRMSNYIQPERLTLTCVGGKTSESEETLPDGTTVKTVYNGYSSYYHTYIRPFEDKNTIKNSMIFIDPPEVSPSAVSIMQMNGLSIWQSEYSADVSTAAEDLASGNDYPMFVAEPGLDSNNFGWWNAVKGTLSSPVNIDGNLGFGGSSGESSDKYPIIQSNVGILKGDGFFTLPEIMNNILTKTVWKFEGFGTFSNTESASLGTTDAGEAAIGDFLTQDELNSYATAGVEFSGTSSRRAPLAVMNECFAIAMSWDFNKVIPNKNYIQSTVGTGDKQYASSVMFIKDDLIDYGQDMDIYQGEPGMYLPEWKMFWTGDMESLLTSISQGISDMVGDAEGGWFTSGNIEPYSQDEYKVVFPKPAGSSSEIYTVVYAPDLDPEDIIELSDEDESKYKGYDKLNGGDRIEAFLKAVQENAVNVKWWGADTSVFESFNEFLVVWDRICGIYTIDSQDMLLALINYVKQQGWDGDWDGLAGRYFISQYYLLTRDNRISGKLGANSVNDIALVTYFWDRYYMPDKMAMWGVLLEDIWKNKDFVQDNLEEGRESFEDWSEMNVIENTEEEMAEDRSMNLENYIYKYLRPDDIVFLPYASSTTDSTLRVYYTPHEELIMASVFNQTQSRSEWESWQGAALPNTRIPVNYHDYIMCLQKNTDYVHNYQIQPTITPEATKNYDVEDLMTIAGEFATNPVSAIKYIVSGMMFDGHRIFGIGPLGSSFDLNWITTNPLYIWISARYVSFIAVVLCAILMIRVVRYLLAGRKDSLWGLAQDCGLLVCTSMVPILVLNSFIWCFSITSKGLLREASYKSLLYETQLKAAERINSDAAVDTEIAIFKQQFDGLTGLYDGVMFDYIQQYDYLNDEPIYAQEAWSDMLENVKFQLTYKGWYDKDGFVPVHRNYYDTSIYYFFYDYLKSSMINYYARAEDGALGQYTSLCSKFDYSDMDIATLPQDKQREILLVEQEFAMSKGGFRRMLRDAEYVYGESILLANDTIYDKPYMRDIWGMYMIFEEPGSVFADSSLQTQIRKSGYWQTWTRSAPFVYNNNTFRKLHPDISSTDLNYANPDVIYYETGRTQLFTSVLDAYNPDLNPGLSSSDGVALNQHFNPVELTPFEAQLAKVIEKSYDDIVEILDLMPDQISDETAISVAAILLTCNLNNMMGVEPSMPILSSMNMDMLLRTILIRDITHLENGVNLLYGLLDEGFGLIGVFAVIFFEVLVAVLFVMRIGLIVSTIMLSLTYGMVQFGFKDFSYRNRLLIGCVTQYIACFLLHTISLFTVYGMAKAISYLHAVPVIGTLGVLCLAIVAFIFLGILHIKLWTIFIADWRHLGGAIIKDVVANKLQHFKARIASLMSRAEHTTGLTQQEESEVSSALISINESSQVTIPAVQQMLIASVSSVSSQLTDAEQNPTTMLWSPEQIPPIQLPAAVESVDKAETVEILDKPSQDTTQSNDHPKLPANLVDSPVIDVEYVVVDASTSIANTKPSTRSAMESPVSDVKWQNGKLTSLFTSPHTTSDTKPVPSLDNFEAMLRHYHSSDN